MLETPVDTSTSPERIQEIMSEVSTVLRHAAKDESAKAYNPTLLDKPRERYYELKFLRDQPRPVMKASKFADVFKSFEPFRQSKNMVTLNTSPIREGFSGYTSIRFLDGRANYLSLWCVAKREIYDALKIEMISIPYDSIYFQVILHLDGKAAIYAKYNQIIGSRLVAYVDDFETVVAQFGGSK